MWAACLGVGFGSVGRDGLFLQLVTVDDRSPVEADHS